MKNVTLVFFREGMMLYMKIVTWNVNGLKACIRKGGFDQLIDLLPDVICLQEVKCKDKPVVIDGYDHFYVNSDRNAYSGCLIMTLEAPENILYGMGDKELDPEARVIAAEYPNYYIVNAYFPNTVDKIERGLFRIRWTEKYREFVSGLMRKKDVILCGDFNATVSEADYYSENTRRFRMEEEGFETDERIAIKEILQLGYIDAFRLLYPKKENVFSHWAVKGGGKEENQGVRLDYFFITQRLRTLVEDVIYHDGITGSDHCPVEIRMGV